MTTQKKDSFWNTGPFSSGGFGNLLRSGPFSKKAKKKGPLHSGPFDPSQRDNVFDAFDPKKGGVGISTHALAALSPVGALLTNRGGGPMPQNVKITSPSMEANIAAAAKRRQAQQPMEIAGAEESAPELPIYGKTLGDFLAQAQSLTDGGIESQLAALAAQRQQAQQSAGAGDAKLAAMYQALQNVTGQDNAAAQARYAQAQQDSAALTAANQANLVGANTAVDNAQDETLANLGIAGANDRPGGAAATQEEAARIANSQNQAIGNTAGQALIAGGLSQGNYGAAMGTAAQFAGASRRSDLQNALMKYLQEISGNEAQLRDSASQQSSSLAGQLYDSDYSQWRDQRDFAANRDDAAFDQAYKSEQLNASDPSKLEGPDKAIYQLQSSGIGPNEQRVIMNLIAQGANSSGTDPKGNKVSTFQGAYRAIQEAVASGQLSPALQGQAVQAAVAAFGSY